MKTQEEHIENGGGNCPKCDSDQIEGRNISIDNGFANQKMSCLDCDAEWIDFYHLTSFQMEE